MSKRIILTLLSAAALLVLAACGQTAGGGEQNAADYPIKSITYMIPFDPGGQSDIEARRQQPFLEQSLGQKIVVTYKPGGGGAVGWTELVGQKPDGYYMAGINIPHIVLQPLSNKDTGYKTEQIQPIAIVQATPIGLAVHKDSGIQTLGDLIAKAKANPGSITVAGSGTYSGHHLAFLQLQKEAGIKMQYVPFTGAAPSVQAFLGKNTVAIMANSNDLLKYKDKMNVLVIGSEKRFKPLPDVPTFKELNFDMTAGIDRGVAVPAGTSDEIIRKLEAAFLEIANSPEIQEQMYKEGFEPKAMGADESKQYIEKKTAQFKPILEELGVLKK